MSSFEARGVTAPYYEILSNLGPSGQFLRVNVSITLDEGPYVGGDDLIADIVTLVDAIPDTSTPSVGKTVVETVAFP